MELDKIDALMELCGKHNVSSVKAINDGLIEVTFFPRVPVATPKEENAEKPKPRQNLMDAALNSVVDANKDK